MTRTRHLIFQLFFALCLMLCSVETRAQEHLDINLSQATISQLAQEVQRQTECTFVYSEDVVGDVRVTVKAKDASLSDILTQALRGTGLTFRITNRHVVIGRAKSNSISIKEERSEQRTISGYIIDATSHESLIGATVYCTETHQGTPSNEYGFFSITLPAGPATMRFSYIGFETQTLALADGGDVSLTVSLQSDNQIEEVEIKADRPETGEASTRTGAVTLPVNFISQVPCLLSEPDVLRAVQTLPGVQKGISGTSGIFVRGGGQEQNLYLLDGVALYNIDHVFGFMSAFMPDAIKNVDFFKSAFPARYGGRLSSVLDVRTKDGDMNSYHGTFSVGLLSSHASLEGPIVKERTSFIVSARRSYIDGLLGLASHIAHDDDINALRPRFYDVNVKLNHIFSDTDHLFGSFYIGKDAYVYDMLDWTDTRIINNDGTTQEITDRHSTKVDMSARWGNVLGDIRWNHIYSPRLFSNTTFAYNKFNFRLNQKSSDKFYVDEILNSVDEYNSKYESGISDITFIHDLDYHPSPSHHIRMGAQYVLHSFLPEVTKGQSFNVISADSVEQTRNFKVDGERSTGHEGDIYAEDDMNLTDRLQMILGLRASLFGVDGKTYPALEPRVSVCYRFDDKWRVKTSYAMMHQYVHLLSTMPISLPSDLWVPVNKDVKPMVSNQVSAGLYTNVIPHTSLSIEGYYKLMDNILDFRDGADFNGAGSAGWQRLVESGKGRSCGLEFFAKHTQDRLSAQVSYTLSKTEHKFGHTINDARWFPFKYDRRHVLTAVAQFKVSERVDFGAQWNIASGARMSVPDKLVQLVVPAPNDKNYTAEYDYTPICSSRNNYRLKSTHSLDINVNFHRQLRHVSRTLSVSIMNVYAHKNQDLVFAWQNARTAREDGSLRPSGAEILETDVRTQQTMLSQTTIIPFLPSISYCVKF